LERWNCFCWKIYMMKYLCKIFEIYFFYINRYNMMPSKIVLRTFKMWTILYSHFWKFFIRCLKIRDANNDMTWDFYIEVHFTLTYTINNHNNYLILCILNCQKRKKLEMDLFLYNVSFNILEYTSKTITINLMNKKYTKFFLWYVTNAFKWWLSSKNTKTIILILLKWHSCGKFLHKP
jgi:hypothetical protein